MPDEEWKKKQAEMQKQLETLQIKAEAQHVAVKPPEFSETNPSIFFTILEAQFELRSICIPQTKFYHVITALPATVLSNISDSTIAGKDYNALKTEILKTFEKSTPELFEKMIAKTIMTGKPSTYLKELRKISSKLGISDELLRHRFIQNLPISIAPVVASQKDVDLDALGSMADELMLITKRSEDLVVEG